jgi:citronellol/citronellal dehydrogenase
VKQTVQAFGGIDVLVNNASAIHLTPTPATPMKRFDLMQQVNTRGAFLCSQACQPHLARAANPHILNISPPLSLAPRWFAPHVAYTIAKYGMSLCVLGMAGEFKSAGIAVNALWPRTIIATAAVQNLLGGDEAIRRARKPDIMGDAAHAILTKPSREFTGRFLIDEDLLREEGVSDFSGYLMVPGAEPLPDFFLPESGD